MTSPYKPSLEAHLEALRAEPIHSANHAEIAAEIARLEPLLRSELEARVAHLRDVITPATTDALSAEIAVLQDKIAALHPAGQ